MNFKYVISNTRDIFFIDTKWQTQVSKSYRGRIVTLFSKHFSWSIPIFKIQSLERKFNTLEFNEDWKEGGLEVSVLVIPQIEISSKKMEKLKISTIFSQIIKAFFQRENPNMNVNIEDSEMTIFLGIMSTKVIKFAFQWF